MRTEEWQRAFRAAELALARADGEPADEEVPEDSSVQRAVGQLLEAVPAIPLLEQPFCRLSDEDRDAAGDEVPANDAVTPTIGPYRVVRELGRGGMGIVYLADRVDGEFRRRVALKVLRRALDSDDFIRRFQNERQILADLCHPNIAELHDGGTTTDGQPYLVMEYVDGATLDGYCAARSLSVRARLDLFLKVCAAVQHAHRSAVIHRDLKPSNILVTKAGEPKLLDFGIAKLLRGDGPAPTGVTNALMRPMTPEYASPEQVQGKPITVGSDVYALGVMLYELLAGCPPYRLHSRVPAEMERVICGEDPPRPSSALEPAGANRGADLSRIRRQLRAELDYIVLKALRKEPAHRYPTVDELVHDIRCHLDGLPVTARRGTVSYRLGKLVRRHRGAVATMLVFVALLVSVAVRENTQRRQIARERDKAEATATFLESLFDASDPMGRQPGVTVREVLDRGAKKIDAFDGRPELQVTYLEIIGGVYRNLGLYDQALSLLRRALDINRQLYSDQHVAVATDLANIGETLYYKEDLAGAESHYRQALAMREALLESDSVDIAESLSNLGLLVADKGELDVAEPLLRRGLDIYRRRLGDTNDLTISAFNNLGSLLHDKGDLDGAENTYRLALDSWHALHGPECPQAATALNNLGLLLSDRDEIQAADPYFREALAIRRKLLGENHPDTIQSINGLGYILLLERRYDEAEPILRDALERRRRILGVDNVGTAMTEISLARLLYRTKRPEQVEPLARHALVTLRHELPSEWRVGLAEGVLGASLTALGRFDEAEPLLVQGCELLDAKKGKTAAITREVRGWLTDHYQARGMTARAEEVRQTK